MTVMDNDSHVYPVPGWGVFRCTALVPCSHPSKYCTPGNIGVLFSAVWEKNTNIYLRQKGVFLLTLQYGIEAAKINLRHKCSFSKPPNIKAAKLIRFTVLRVLRHYMYLTRHSQACYSSSRILIMSLTFSGDTSTPPPFYWHTCRSRQLWRCRKEWRNHAVALLPHIVREWALIAFMTGEGLSVFAIHG